MDLEIAFPESSSFSRITAEMCDYNGHMNVLFYLKGSCHERGRIEKIPWNKFEAINTPLFSMNHHTEFSKVSKI